MLKLFAAPNNQGSVPFPDPGAILETLVAIFHVAGGVALQAVINWLVLMRVMEHPGKQPKNYMLISRQIFVPNITEYMIMVSSSSVQAPSKARLSHQNPTESHIHQPR